MLYCLMDNRARTGTELAVIAEVTPSTASAHLNRLRSERLIRVQVQGKHRFYQLEGPEVAKVLEGLSVLAGGFHSRFVPNTPGGLRAARTCYDHVAGTLGVSLHDRLQSLGWIASDGPQYEVTGKGVAAFRSLGVDIEHVRDSRRRFAFACLDWSERRSHLGGALGAAILQLLLNRKWVTQDLDSRVLVVTNGGRRGMLTHFGLSVEHTDSKTGSR